MVGDECTTQNGYNPLLEEFANTAVLVSEPPVSGQ
jgi:hypothetical protein